MNFADKVVLLPSRYFGVAGKVDSQKAQTADGSTIRALDEVEVTLPEGGTKHLFAGDIIPTGVQVASTTEIKVPFYTQKDDIICKVIHNRAIPFMSAFEVATDFSTLNHLLKHII